MQKLRIIDTGLRSGRENIAFDQAMIDARFAGEIPNSLRFIHFKPVALVGRHQDITQEIKIDECARLGVEIGRRITGGGAIYFDENQLGWALICDKQSLKAQNLGEITELICRAAATGLSKLGIDARFRPRNDIEVNGKKISGTGGFFDGDILMYQGTILIDLDPAKLGAVLNIPTQKQSNKSGAGFEARVTSLKDELGHVPDIETIKSVMIKGFHEELGFEIEIDAPNQAEENRAKQIFNDEIGQDDFVYEINNLGRDSAIFSGTKITKGGVVCANLRKEGPRNDRIREIIFTGDFFVAPPRIIYDLEAKLRNQPIERANETIHAFFQNLGNSGLLSVGADDFCDALQLACKK